MWRPQNDRQNDCYVVSCSAMQWRQIHKIPQNLILHPAVSLYLNLFPVISCQFLEQPSLKQNGAYDLLKQIHINQKWA